MGDIVQGIDILDSKLKVVKVLKGDFGRATTMPTASTSNVGDILQYIGETTTDYTKGYFYECTASSTTPVTYSWVRTDVQPGGSSSAVSDVKVNNVSILDSSRVANLPYAGTSDAGVIKTNTGYGTSTNNGGILQAETKTYAEYNATADTMFVGKGTLNNVITGKNLVSRTDYATVSQAGVVKPDGTTITVDANGVISSSGAKLYTFSGLSIPTSNVTTKSIVQAVHIANLAEGSIVTGEVNITDSPASNTSNALMTITRYLYTETQSAATSPAYKIILTSINTEPCQWQSEYLSEHPDAQISWYSAPLAFNIMPTASQTYYNKIAQYVGSIGGTYVPGTYYQCVEDTSTSPSTYKWELMTISNNVASDSIQTEELTYRENGTTEPAVYANVKTKIDSKQATLISGTNIKTINNNPILGSGNINLQTDNYNYEVKRFASQSTSSASDPITIDGLANENSLIFKNGQLLKYDNDYTCGIYAIFPSGSNYVVNSKIWFVNQLSSDNIIVINGLSAKHFIGNTGITLDIGYNIESNTLILKNSVLLTGWSRSQTSDTTIVFETALVSSDDIAVLSNYNGNYYTTNITGTTLQLTNYTLAENTLIWKDTVLLMLGQDYTISGDTITFTTALISSNTIQVSTPKVNNLYVALSSKQDKLPVMQSGKYLTNDGNTLKWETPQDTTYTAGAGIDITNNVIKLNEIVWFYDNLYVHEISSVPANKITINQSTFFAETDYQDNYFTTFEYDGTDWKVGEDIVDLSDYGITLDGSYTPEEDNSFTIAGNYTTGKTEFTVVLLPFSILFLNGLPLIKGLDYTLEEVEMGITITFTNYTLKSTDKFGVL